MDLKTASLQAKLMIHPGTLFARSPLKWAIRPTDILALMKSRPTVEQRHVTQFLELILPLSAKSNTFASSQDLISLGFLKTWVAVTKFRVQTQTATWWLPRRRRTEKHKGRINRKTQCERSRKEK